MATNPQRPKGRYSGLSSLNGAIEVLNRAKEICSITPAKAAFGSVSGLLATIRVRLLLSFDHGLSVHLSPGIDDQKRGLRRTWVVMRRRMQGPRPGIEGETG